MNSDFRLSVGYFTHTKIGKLSCRLGDSGVLAHIRLLSYTAQNRPDGRLTRMDADDIALASGYAGDIHALIAALLEIFLLDKDEDGVLSLHDWAEHNPWASGAPDRTESGKKAAEARWAKEREKKEREAAQALTKEASNTVNDANRNADLCDPHHSALPDASFRNAPFLSFPSPANSLPSEAIPSPAKPSPPTQAQAQAREAPPTAGPEDPDGPEDLDGAEPPGVAGRADFSNSSEKIEEPENTEEPEMCCFGGTDPHGVSWQDKATLLCRQKIGAAKAARLAKAHSLPCLQHQIHCLPKRRPPSPGVLATAIDKHWETPPEVLDAKQPHPRPPPTPEKTSEQQAAYKNGAAKFRDALAQSGALPLKNMSAAEKHAEKGE